MHGGDGTRNGCNFLSTNLSSGVQYSNRTLVDSDNQFGIGSRYFTAKYPGLWVLAASRTSINEFLITGDLGADGGGQVDGAVLSLLAGGQRYTLLVKRVYNTSDPSVNHIIIVPGNGAGVSHDFPPSTNPDFHRVTGLQNSSEFYYLLLLGPAAVTWPTPTCWRSPTSSSATSQRSAPR